MSTMSQNRWIAMTEDDPEHSARYIERFTTMAAAGADLGGEARLIDAMVARCSRILDAGCGPGRVGGHLADAGHQVVGVDIDPVLIDAARREHPSSTWIAADLAELSLAELDPDSVGIGHGFDAIVCAGNVVTFLDPATRRPVLDRLAAHLRTDGRLVVGFGAGRDYPFDDFFDDARAVGLVTDSRFSTWDLRPFSADSDFLVAVLSRAS